MAEVGVHFEYIVISFFYRPLEPGDIGSSQSQFTLALYHEQAVGKFLLQPAYNSCRAVRRAVFYD